MRTLYAMVVAALLAAGLVGCNPKPEQAPPPPRNSIVHDFGTARQSATVNHTFAVTNPEKEAIRVTRVQTTCGCTVTSLEKGTEIAPSASVDVPVVLDLHGKHDKVESKVMIAFAKAGDAPAPEAKEGESPMERAQRRAAQTKSDVLPTELVMKGTVKQEYPESIAFDRFNRGAQPENVVELATFEGQPPLSITGIDFDAEVLDISQLAAANGAYTITIKPNAQAPFGGFDEEVVIHTNDTQVPDKRIHVRGRVSKPLERMKARLTLTPDNAGGPARGVAEFFSPYQKSIENPTATITKPKRFTASIEPGQSGDQLKVNVEGTSDKGNTKKEYARGQLTVTATIDGETVSETVDVILMFKPLAEGETVPEAGDDAEDEEDEGQPKGKG